MDSSFTLNELSFGLFVSLLVGLDGTELTTESITNEAFLTSVGQIHAALGGQVGRMDEADDLPPREMPILCM